MYIYIHIFIFDKCPLVNVLIWPYGAYRNETYSVHVVGFACTDHRLCSWRLASIPVC